ncbi:MAG: hypothetical protein K6E38_00095 [Fretibacterium sp.]|nr:hypothetical protein [Fretibacterium sp.]
MRKGMQSGHGCCRRMGLCYIRKEDTKEGLLARKEQLQEALKTVEEALEKM